MKDKIQAIKSRLQSDDFPNESAVKQCVILPIFNALNWDVFDPKTVFPEFSVENGRVDYALRDARSKIRVLVEVKARGKIKESSIKQLLNYAFGVGAQLALLTDGQEWALYLPAGEGTFEERQVYKLDLLERETDECVERLNRYLEFKRVCSGEAFESAKRDYEDVTKERIICETLPRAWHDLTEGNDSVLLYELLQDKVSDICGHKPSIEVCRDFICRSVHKMPLENRNQSSSYSEFRSTQKQPESKKSKRVAMEIQAEVNQQGDTFTLLGKQYPFKPAIGGLKALLLELQRRDSGFLYRFAAAGKTKKRNIVAQKKEDLFLNRPDLCETHAKPLTDGWWLGANCSTEKIISFMELAAEVAGLTWGRDVAVNQASKS